jgi:hypothetical protein
MRPSTIHESGDFNPTEKLNYYQVIHKSQGSGTAEAEPADSSKGA